MGKLQTFDIILQGNGVYYAGQVVTGTVMLVLNEPIKLRELRLSCKGDSNVHWTERHTRGSGDNRRTETVHYRNHENYMSFKISLFIPDNSEHHPAGSYQYPFNFQLPPNLPSSFEGQHGNVRYSIKGTIDRPWRFDHNCKRLFTILANHDLNTMPHLMNPCEIRNDKTLCCLCCASGPISAYMRLERTGFVPGENVCISGECDNKSSRTMSASRIELVQVVAFHAHTKTRHVTRTVASLLKGEIGPGDTEYYNRDTLHIPPLPPSGLLGCRIIDVSYTLRMVVDPSGPSLDLTAPISITVGTIPLRNVTAYYSPYMYGMTPTAPPQEPPPPTESGAMPPPPSYAECMFGKVDVHDEDDNEYTRGQMNWAPTYVYYSWAGNNTGGAPAIAPPPPAGVDTVPPVGPPGVTLAPPGGVVLSAPGAPPYS